MKRHSIPIAPLPEKYDEIAQKINQSFFYLPEYYTFRHYLIRLDPQIISYLTTDKQLKSAAEYHLQAYNACLSKLDNKDGKHPYNLVITKDWMLMVNRAKPQKKSFEQPLNKFTDCNSLAYIGLFSAEDEEQKKLIQELKPIEILTNLAQKMDKNELRN